MDTEEFKQFKQEKLKGSSVDYRNSHLLEELRLEFNQRSLGITSARDLMAHSLAERGLVSPEASSHVANLIKQDAATLAQSR